MKKMQNKSMTFRKKEIQKRTSILLFVFAVGIFFPMHSIAQSGVLLGGAAGQGPIRLANGAECRDCEHITNFMFGNWTGGVRLIRAHGGLQDLKFEFNFSIDNLTGFSGKNLQGGTASYSINEFEVSKRRTSYEFEVVLKLSGPQTGKKYSKIFNIKLSIPPEKQQGIPTKLKENNQWTFGPGDEQEILDELRKLIEEKASLSKIRDTYKVKVDSWKLIKVNYPNLEAYDDALGERLKEKADKVKHDELVRQAQKAQSDGKHEASSKLYEEALSYYDSDDTREKLDHVKENITQSRKNNNGGNTGNTNSGNVNSSQQSNSSNQSRTNSETDADEGTTKKDDREKSQEKKARKKKAQEKYEDLKRAEQERERQKAIDEQTARNQQAAIELSAAAILVHTMIAKFIYANMNQTATQSHFPGPSGRVGIQVGYGLSYIPFHRWEGNGDDYNGGNNSEVLTLDLNAQFNYDLLYTEHFGLGGYAGGALGHLLQEYRLKWNAGLQSFWGAPGFKLLGRYEIGADNLTHKSWIDADLDNQTYGKERWRHQRFSLGPRISWGNQRHHLDLLYNFDYIYNRSEYFSGEIWAHNEPQKHARGLSLRYWQQGKFNLSLDYLQMPLPGETTPQLQFSFLRSIDGYQGTVGRFDFEDLRDRVKPQDRWTLSFLNPELTWQNQNSELKAAEKPVISAPLRLLHVNREFMLSPSLSIAPGLGFTSNRGITRIQGTDRLRLIKPLNLDVPLALRWYAIQRSLKHFWLGANYEYSFNLAGIHRVVNEEEYNLDEDTRVENSPLRDQSARYHLGLGMDVALNPQSALRFALFYQWAPQLGAPGYSISTSAFRLQAALIL